jgi:hypothetical protein
MIKKLTNNINPRINRTQKLLDAIPKKAHMKFKTVTPIKSGNAKRNTDFNGTDTISGNYNYANRLNKGWSKQARNGMTEPTIDFIRNEVRKIVR